MPGTFPPTQLESTFQSPPVGAAVVLHVIVASTRRGSSISSARRRRLWSRPVLSRRLATSQMAASGGALNQFGRSVIVGVPHKVSSRGRPADTGVRLASAQKRVQPEGRRLSGRGLAPAGNDQSTIKLGFTVLATRCSYGARPQSFSFGSASRRLHRFGKCHNALFLGVEHGIMHD